MSKLQYVRSKIKVIKEVQNRTFNERVTNKNKTIDATNACNDLKKYLREEIKIRGIDKEKHIKAFIRNIFKTTIVTDAYSQNKYYPAFLMSKCPRGINTTISRLILSEDYIFEGSGFVVNQATPTYDNFGLVLGYSTRIESKNKGAFFHTPKDKIKEISLDTEFKTFTNPKLDLSLYLGVELEVVRKYNAPMVICENVIKDLNIGFTTKQGNYSFAILKSDSSLLSHGFEIVSAPATLNYHKTAWDKFFANSAKYLRSYNTDCCGMHVHISKLGFDGDPTGNNLHIGKFMNFYNQPYNRKFITDIAGRSTSSYTSYNVKKIVQSGTVNVGNTDRRQSVNLCPPNTIEIRIFKGNTRKEGFFKNLEFVHASVEFTRQASMNYCSSTPVTSLKTIEDKRGNISVDLSSKNTKGLTYEEFLTWLVLPENISTYPNLTRWLKAKGMIKSDRVKLVDDKTNDKQVTYAQYLDDVA